MYSCELKRFEEALDSYDHALAREPDNISALLGRGHALREINRNDEALISYDRVLVLIPPISTRWRTRSRC